MKEETHSGQTVRKRKKRQAHKDAFKKNDGTS